MVTAEDIVGVLEGRGWEAEIAEESTVPAIIKTSPTGLLKCVDGRPSDHPSMDGPKSLGGVYAIMTNRGITDLDGLKEVVKEVKAKGYVPSVHGDDHAHPAPMGCGFFKLWSQGKLEGVPPPEFDSEQGQAAVLEAGGVYEELSGSHKEKIVYINLVAGTTIAPNAGNQAFVVDAWIAGDFNLDIPKYLGAAASTVEQLGGPLKAKIITPSAPLTVQDVVGVLQGRGWEAEIVKQSTVSGLIPVNPKGLMKCVDGRPSDHPAMNGPKTLGGVYAIATNRGVTSIDGLKNIVEEVKQNGHVPSVHGDDHAHPAPMGCGFFKLWSLGKLDGIPPPDFDSEEGQAAVLDAGGVYEQLSGNHEEKVVYINFVPDTTIAPKGNNQAFVVDAWITDKFNLDVPKYLIAAASTVEQLKGPLKAKLIVPSKTSCCEFITQKFLMKGRYEAIEKE